MHNALFIWLDFGCFIVILDYFMLKGYFLSILLLLPFVNIQTYCSQRDSSFIFRSYKLVLVNTKKNVLCNLIRWKKYNHTCFTNNLPIHIITIFLK